MTVLNDKKIKVINKHIKELIYINPERKIGILEEQTLANINIKNNQLLRCMRCYLSA